MRDIGAEHNAFGIAGAVLTPADGGGGYIPVPLATAIAITDEQRLALDYGGDSLYPQAAARRRSTSRARMTVDGASAELLSAAHGAVVEGKQAHGGYAEKINGDAPLQFTITEALSEFLDIVAHIDAGGETTISLLTPAGLERFVLPWASLGYYRLGERLIIHRTQAAAPEAAVSGRWLASPTRSVISPPRAAGVKEWNVTAMTARGGVYDRQHILRMYRAVFDGGTRRLRDNATSDGAQEFGLTLLGYPAWELSIAAPAGDVAASAKTASRELFALVEGDNAKGAANGWSVGVTTGPNLLSQNRPMQFNVGVDFASAFFGSAQELLAELTRPAESGVWWQAEISFKQASGGGILRWQFSRAAAEVRDNQLIITPPADARSFTNAAAGWTANIPAGETGADIYTSAQNITGDFRLWLVRADNAPAVLANVIGQPTYEETARWNVGGPGNPAPTNAYYNDQFTAQRAAAIFYNPRPLSGDFPSAINASDIYRLVLEGQDAPGDDQADGALGTLTIFGVNGFRVGDKAEMRAAFGDGFLIIVGGGQWVLSRQIDAGGRR